MQPGQNQNDWQQPPAQPPQSPYTTSPQQPVVTLAPDAQSPVPPASVDVSRPQATSAPVAEPIQPAPQEAAIDDKVEEDYSLQEPVYWQANEYIHHEKSLLWFVIFTIIIIAFLVIDFFLIQSITFGVLVPVMAAALLVYTHRPPRVIDYTLSSKGIHVNDHLYSFSEFKAFGVMRDGEEYSVMLLPTKRFRQGTTIYFPEEAGEAIVDMLGARLPMQELHLDIVDKIIRKLRI